MLRIKRDVDAFLEGNLLCERGNHDSETDAEFLAMCTYEESPHTIGLCQVCALKLEESCECGSGAHSSGSICSVLSRDGTELDFRDFHMKNTNMAQNAKKKDEGF